MSYSVAINWVFFFFFKWTSTKQNKSTETISHVSQLCFLPEKKKKLVIFFCPVLICSVQDREYFSTGPLLHQGHHLKTLQEIFEYFFNSMEALVCCTHQGNPRIKEIQISAISIAWTETIGPNSWHCLTSFAICPEVWCLFWTLLLRAQLKNSLQ